jgi:RNA polymerase sigma-70 factor (ECF subfamily)
MPFLRARPELLAAFRRGDRGALEEVYWAYVERVERVVRRGYAVVHKGVRVEGAHVDQVGDLVQEVFVRAFAERARQSYDGLRDYGPFLSTIARNRLTDWARGRGRELRQLPLDDVDELADADGGSAAPEPWADPDTLRVVEAYLASLDDELRAVHRERYENGRSQEQAAQVLGCSRQQLRTKENRLRDGLRKALRMANLSD